MSFLYLSKKNNHPQSSCVRFTHIQRWCLYYEMKKSLEVKDSTYSWGFVEFICVTNISLIADRIFSTHIIYSILFTSNNLYYTYTHNYTHCAHTLSHSHPHSTLYKIYTHTLSHALYHTHTRTYAHTRTHTHTHAHTRKHAPTHLHTHKQQENMV